MMGITDNPVTLVVKAPNQRIEDQTVDCFLDWTVRKLKQHLEAVYPSKPKYNQQKLIYSGRLLPDDVTLKEVLRQIDEAALHTVHLVCSHADHSSTENPDSSSPELVPSGSDYSTVSSSTAENLRFRGSNPSNNHPSVFSPSSAPEFPNQALYNQMMASVGTGGHMMMPPQAGYQTPLQYMWMQQMYAQYMAQYMQYYQNLNPTAPLTQAAPSSAVTNDRAANQNRPVNAPAANQNVRMNAQGGVVEDDDDEDVEHRDWLDYIFVSFRFLVLVSIVYFYSSLSRFIYVLGGFFFVYLLQNGWKLLRQNARPAAPVEQQAPAEAAPAQPPEPAAPAGDQAPQNDGGNVEVRDDAAEGNQQNAPVADKPGAFALFWCFVSTFFTSLIPQPPPGVNGN